MEKTNDRPSDFIRDIIDADLASGKHQRVATRFPPEPNGYLHIGHAKAICLNFGLARDYNGTCNLRFDDTNPEKESVEYTEAIERDVRWLGFDWGERSLYASDYFETMYELAVKLIENGKAYVCSLSGEELREYRGTLTTPGVESPYRARSVEENLDLFARMRAGEFEDGAHVLRAKIDMAAANMKMRDPLLYRIRHQTHHRTGDDWCIYPMYDYAHPLEDAIEEITHSICTLEFENNRELYDWVVRECETEAVPEQIEFARLNLDYTVMSKRKLLRLVEDGVVGGWDDPRMPTIAGMRRRGYTPASIRTFATMVGVAKNNSTVDIGKLEYCVRDDLNHHAKRVMAVLRPLKVVITNYDGDGEKLDAPYFPPDIRKSGSRSVPFARELFIEASDFEEQPPAKYRRLAPGRIVRLRYAYCIRCDDVVNDPQTGEPVELHCTYFPETSGGGSPEGEKVSGVIHWVSAKDAVRAEVRLYDRLLEVPVAGDDFLSDINESSLEVLSSLVEPSVASDETGTHYQFERQGYFISDAIDSTADALVFNRIVELRDSWTVTKKVAADVLVATDKVSASGKTRPPKRSKSDLRNKARAEDPTLAERYERYKKTPGLSAGDADILSGDRELADLFDTTLAAHAKPTSVAKWLINELPRAVGERSLSELPTGGAELGALIALVDAKTISSASGKTVLAELAASGGDAATIVERLGLAQVSDESAVEPAVETVIARFPEKAAQYRAGKTGLLGFFVGQVMKESGGAANPKLVSDLVAKKLED